MGSLREVFPTNLKILMQGQPSISEFCRTVGVDRNKVNRYLSGQSSPPPEELKKICDHFEVSADILLHPADPTIDANDCGKILSAVLSEQLIKRDFLIMPRRLPSGLYRQWRHSVSQPGKIFCNLVRVYRKGEATLTRLIDPWSAYGFSEQFRSRKSREVTGVLLAQPMGFCEICFSDGTTHLSMTYYLYGYKSLESCYLGHYVTIPHNRSHASRGKEFLEYLGTETSNILTAARNVDFHEFDEAPSHVRQALGRLNDPDPEY